MGEKGDFPRQQDGKEIEGCRRKRVGRGWLSQMDSIASTAPRQQPQGRIGDFINFKFGITKLCSHRKPADLNSHTFQNIPTTFIRTTLCTNKINKFLHPQLSESVEHVPCRARIYGPPHLTRSNPTNEYTITVELKFIWVVTLTRRNLDLKHSFIHSCELLNKEELLFVTTFHYARLT